MVDCGRLIRHNVGEDLINSMNLDESLRSLNMSTEEAERFAEEPLKDDDEERLFDLIETEGSPNRPNLLMITQNIKKVAAKRKHDGQPIETDEESLSFRFYWSDFIGRMAR